MEQKETRVLRFFAMRREIERQKELYLMAHPEENDKE